VRNIKSASATLPMCVRSRLMFKENRSTNFNMVQFVPMVQIVQNVLNGLNGLNFLNSLAGTPLST